MLFSFRPIAIFVRFNERFKAFTLFRKTIDNFLLTGHNRISIEISDKSSFKLSAAYHTNGHLIEFAQIFTILTFTLVIYSQKNKFVLIRHIKMLKANL